MEILTKMVMLEKMHLAIAPRDAEDPAWHVRTRPRGCQMAKRDGAAH